MMSTGTGAEQERGREAEVPAQIPKAGWRDVLLRLKDAIREDRITLIAAGVAFYAMLALFPAMIVVVSIYGLLMDPERSPPRSARWVSCPATSGRSSPASSTPWPAPPAAGSA